MILSTPKSTSCRSVTTEELYRITRSPSTRSIRTIAPDTIKPGDLSGIVNLKQLAFRGKSPLPAGTFNGADIDKLLLTGVTISEGTFQGMVSSIAHLTLDNVTIAPNGFVGLPPVGLLTIQKGKGMPPLDNP